MLKNIYTDASEQMPQAGELRFLRFKGNQVTPVLHNFQRICR